MPGFEPKATSVTPSITNKTLAIGESVDIKMTHAPAGSVMEEFTIYESTSPLGKYVDITTAKGEIINNQNFWTVKGTDTITVTARVATTMTNFKLLVRTGTQPSPSEITIVVPTPVKGVTLNKTELNLTKGKTDSITATVNPTYASNTNVKFSSTDYNVTSLVQGSGSKSVAITGKNGGTTVVTVTTDDGGFTADCTVNVTVPVTGVTLDKTELTLQNGEIGKITATVQPEDATNKTVEFQPMSSLVAMVDGAGNITTMGAGEVDITATTEDGNFVATCKLIVTE